MNRMQGMWATEITDLSARLTEAMNGQDAVDRGVFESQWEQAGHPPDVRLSLRQARLLRLLYPPTDFRPLDSVTFQMPFLRLHVIR